MALRTSTHKSFGRAPRINPSSPLVEDEASGLMKLNTQQLHAGHSRLMRAPMEHGMLLNAKEYNFITLTRPGGAVAATVDKMQDSYSKVIRVLVLRRK